MIAKPFQSAEQLGRTNATVQKESMQQREILAQPISRISIVVPVYNENNQDHSLQSFEKALSLQRNLPKNIDTALIFVNNNSTDGTEHIVSGIKIGQGTTTVIDEPQQGVGHAMRTGIHEAIRLRAESGISPEKHVIVTTAADTQLGPDFLSTVLKEYSLHEQLMLSSGPIQVEFKRKLFGLFKTLNSPYFFQQLLSGLSLRYRFFKRRRHISDYINRPFEIFPGYNVAIRETGYVDFPGNSSAEEDVQRTLYEKRNLRRGNIMHLSGQKVLTNGDWFEKQDKNLELSFIKTLFKAMDGGVRTSSFLQEMPVDIIKEIVDRVDTDAFSLAENETIKKIIGPLRARFAKIAGKEVRQAKEGILRRSHRYGIVQK